MWIPFFFFHLFWGPSPTRYSMTRSTAPLSLGRMGLASGGPGGCMPANISPQTLSVITCGSWPFMRHIKSDFEWCNNLPTPGIGEQSGLGTAPWGAGVDRANLSGGPPGAERGRGTVDRATRHRTKQDVYKAAGRAISWIQEETWWTF